MAEPRRKRNRETAASQRKPKRNATPKLILEVPRARDSITGRKRNARHTNGDKTSVKTTPIKGRKKLYRVPIATWNFFVKKWEIPRKTLHVSIGNTLNLSIHEFCLIWLGVGFVCLYLYKLGYEPRDVAPLLVYIFIPAFFGDVVRFTWPAFNRLWTRVMGPLMRDREKQQWNGVIFYLLGAWTVLSFFPKVLLPL